MTQVTFTVSEVARMLGISRSTAYQCVERGEIVALRLGRRILITRSELARLLGEVPLDHSSMP